MDSKYEDRILTLESKLLHIEHERVLFSKRLAGLFFLSIFSIFGGVLVVGLITSEDLTFVVGVVSAVFVLVLSMIAELFYLIVVYM